MRERQSESEKKKLYLVIYWGVNDKINCVVFMSFYIKKTFIKYQK